MVSATPIADALVPALDEEPNIARVVAAAAPHVRRVVVVDNGSRDRTAEAARAAGAVVVAEPRRGYGAACLAGIAHLADPARGGAPPPDVLVFLDGDGADDGAGIPALVDPIARGAADLVLGSRTLDGAGVIREPGALTPQQRF